MIITTVTCLNTKINIGFHESVCDPDSKEANLSCMYGVLYSVPVLRSLSLVSRESLNSVLLNVFVSHLILIF